MAKAGITVAIKGEIKDLESKISQSKEIINEATKQIIAENNKLNASQELVTKAQQAYSKEIKDSSNEIKKYLAIKSKNGKLTKEEQQNLSAARASLSLYKTKTKELVDVEKQKQQEIKKTIIAQKEMSNLQRASIADARLEIDSKRKIIQLEKENAKTKNKSAESTSNLANQTIRYLRWAGTIAGVVYAGKRAWDATLGSGIAVNKMMEDNTSGIAALLTANTRMTLSNGKAVNSYEKFQIAGVKSAAIMEELRLASVKTYATYPQLVSIYQQMIGHTMSMGDQMGKNVNEISSNTIELAKILSNIGGAIGMEMQKVNEEARSIISGTASTDSLIAMMVFGSPTQANEAIRKAKEMGTNGVKDMLMGVLESYKVLEGVKTYTRAELDLQDAISQTQKMLAKPAFEALKDVYTDLAVVLRENQKEVEGWGETFVEFTKLAIEYGDDILIALVAWKVIPKILKNINISMADVTGATKSWTNASIVATGVNHKLAKSVKAIGTSLKSLVVANAPLLAVMAAYEGYNYLVGESVEKEEALNKIRNKTAEDLNKISSTQLEYNKALLAEQIILKTRELQNAKARVANKGIFGKDQLEQKKDKASESQARQELTELKQLKATTENILEKRKQILTVAEKQGELQTKYARDKSLEEEAVKFLKKTEDEVVKLQETKQKASDYLLKKEKELQEIQTKYKDDTEARKDVEESISKTKAYLLGIDKQIAEVRQKQSEKELTGAEAKEKKLLSQNRSYAEQQAIKQEIAMIESGIFDSETLREQKSILKITSLSEEYALLTKIEDKEKVKLELLQEFLRYEKLVSKIDTTSYDIMSESYSNMLDSQLQLVNSTQDWMNGLDGVAGKIAGVSKSFANISKININNEKKQDKATRDFTKQWLKLYEAKKDTTQLEKDHEKNIQKLRKEGEQNQIKGYAGIANAMSQFFEQGSREAAAFQAIEAGLAIVAGIKAILTQGSGDPYTAFARMAAMAASVATLLSSANIAFGGNKTTVTSDTFSAMAENTGTGSVLGDTSAQSESLVNSMGILEDFAEPQYQTLLSMNKYLETIASNIGGVTSLLIQQGGYAFGTGYTAPTFEDSGIGISFQKALDSIAVFDPVNKLLGSVFGFSGASDKLTGAILGGIFGKTSVSQSLTDSGIYFANTLLTTATKQILGKAYQTIKTETTKKSWFHKSSSTSISTYFKALDAETNRQFSLVLNNLYDTTILAGKALDSSAEQTAKSLENFVVSIGKISLKGKTGDQIQEQLQAVFGRIGDDIAKTAFPLLAPFQHIGEGMFETLTRVATGMEEAEYYIERLGQAFSDISYTDILNTQGNVGFEALLTSIIKTDEATYGLNNNLVQIIGNLNTTAEELYGAYVALDTLRDTLNFLQLDVEGISSVSIRGAGSIGALSSGVENYIENFLSDEEKLAYHTGLLSKEFEKINVEMPTSKDAFTDILESIDLTTEAGQYLYGRLIILSEGFAELSDEAEGVYDKSISRISDIQNAFLDLIGIIDTTINNLLGRQAGSTTETTISNYLQKRGEVDVLLEKGSSLTDTEMKSLNKLVSELASMASTIQSGFTDNTAVTGNLVQDLALIKSKLNYTNQFVSNDLTEAKANILSTGFSEGGYTGAGGKYEIKGAVHGNEWVINSEQVNAIGGADAVKNMVQREIIQKNTNTTSRVEYSNSKSGIIQKLEEGQNTLAAGFNAMLTMLEEIIDYQDERREAKHAVVVSSGSVVIEG